MLSTLCAQHSQNLHCIAILISFLLLQIIMIMKLASHVLYLTNPHVLLSPPIFSLSMKLKLRANNMLSGKIVKMDEMDRWTVNTEHEHYNNIPYPTRTNIGRCWYAFSLKYLIIENVNAPEKSVDDSPLIAVYSCLQVA